MPNFTYEATEFITLDFDATASRYEPATLLQPEEGGEIEVSHIDAVVNLDGFTKDDIKEAAKYFNADAIKLIRQAIAIPTASSIKLKEDYLTKFAERECERYASENW